MINRSSRDLLIAWAEAWTAHDIAAFVELFADDVVYEDVPLAKTLNGLEEMRHFFRDSLQAFPDFRMDIRSLVAGAEGGAVEWTLTATHLGDTDALGPASGKSLVSHGCSVAVVERGRVTRWADYWDMVPVSQQLGLS